MKTFRVKQRIEAMSVGKRFERGAVINEATLPRELMASLFEDGVIELVGDEIEGEVSAPWLETSLADESVAVRDEIDAFDLTQIKGVGVKVAEKLIEGGLVELEDVANASVEGLVALGIRKSVAGNIIDAAGELFGLIPASITTTSGTLIANSEGGNDG